MSRSTTTAPDGCITSDRSSLGGQVAWACGCGTPWHTLAHPGTAQQSPTNGLARVHSRLHHEFVCCTCSPCEHGRIDEQPCATCRARADVGSRQQVPFDRTALQHGRSWRQDHFTPMPQVGRKGAARCGAPSRGSQAPSPAVYMLTPPDDHGPVDGGEGHLILCVSYELDCRVGVGEPLPCGWQQQPA